MCCSVLCCACALCMLAGAQSGARKEGNISLKGAHLHVVGDPDSEHRSLLIGGAHLVQPRMVRTTYVTVAVPVLSLYTCTWWEI